jgi:DNA-binding NarL/FixJ family response regulator
MSDEPPRDLTPRETDVARLIAAGLTNKQIGGQLGLAHNTVRVHVASIAFKLRAYVGDKDARVMIAQWYRAAHPIGQAA